MGGGERGGEGAIARGKKGGRGVARESVKVRILTVHQNIGAETGLPEMEGTLLGIHGCLRGY